MYWPRYWPCVYVRVCVYVYTCLHQARLPCTARRTTLRQRRRPPPLPFYRVFSTCVIIFFCCYEWNGGWRWRRGIIVTIIIIIIITMVAAAEPPPPPLLLLLLLQFSPRPPLQAGRWLPVCYGGPPVVCYPVPGVRSCRPTGVKLSCAPLINRTRPSVRFYHHHRRPVFFYRRRLIVMVCPSADNLHAAHACSLCCLQCRAVGIPLPLVRRSAHNV